ncbi:hypothetical protein Golob_015141, partial [Gossypium lobatum]|nr:hypothetical protein [Gossypium lobatum]
MLDQMFIEIVAAGEKVWTPSL